MPDQTNNNEEVSVLLPTLISNHNFTKPKQSGKWEGVKADDLLGISKSLDAKSSNLQVNSIPDIWSRLVLFEAALFDKEHKLHEIALGEWRGLLAVLALKELKRLNYLSVVNFSLEDNIQIEENNKILHLALKKLQPKTQIFNSTTWDNLCLFVVDKQVIGITSPVTLVVTPTEYNYLTKDNVGWYDGEKFSDPITHLTNLEKNGLTYWLENLHNSLRKESTVSNQNRINHLLQLLEVYTTEINGNVEGLTLSNRGLGITGAKYGVFNFLDKPVTETISNRSCVQLVPSITKRPDFSLLVVDGAIVDQWRTLPHMVTVYGNSSLADIPYGGLPKNQHSRFANYDLENVEVWNPTYLFTEKLYYIEGLNALPGALNPNWYQNIVPKIQNEEITVILPINPILLEYYKIEELCERLQFFQEPSGEVNVKLRLTLSGLNENEPKEFEITKKYNGEVMIPFTQTPILEVFPNFVAENWNAYYVAYSADSIKNTFQVSPYPNTPKFNEVDIHSQDEKRCLWKLTKFPEAFVCTYRENLSSSDEEIGIIPMKEPQMVKHQNKEYTVGIDFGASGTMIYYSGKEGKMPLTFSHNRKIAVTAKNDLQKPKTIKFFLPDEDITPAFLTIYHDFNNSHNDNQTLINGHIYFHSGLQDLDEENIYSNLKWAEDSRINSLVKFYLEQICLQSCAELVAQGASSIQWRFSYPTSFDTTQTQNYQSILRTVIQSITNLTTSPSNNIRLVSESVAAAECFRNGGAFINGTEASIMSGAVFIDIGGSTSDVSIFEDNEFIKEFSLRFAGRDLILKYFEKNQHLLKELNVSNYKFEENNTEKFWTQIDSILQKDGNRILEKLPLHAQNQEIIKLKTYLATGLAGLVYYVGLTLRHLRRHTSPVLNDFTPHIYLAGNGSQMFNWLTNGTKIKESANINSLFRNVFSESLQERKDENRVKVINIVRDQISFELIKTEKPKHEAAYGLVCDQNVSSRGNSRIISGESFRIGETDNGTWHTEMDETILSQKLKAPTALMELPIFVRIFNESQNEFKINYNSSTETEVRRKLNDLLSESNRIEQKAVFILALKALLDTMI